MRGPVVPPGLDVVVAREDGNAVTALLGHRAVRVARGLAEGHEAAGGAAVWKHTQSAKRDKTFRFRRLIDRRSRRLIGPRRIGLCRTTDSATRAANRCC